MDSSVKQLQAISVDQIKKHQGPYKREFQKISHGFKSLSQAFGSDMQACESLVGSGCRVAGHSFYKFLARLRMC